MAKMNVKYFLEGMINPLSDNLNACIALYNNGIDIIF